MRRGDAGGPSPRACWGGWEQRQSRWVWVWTHWPPHWPAGLAVPLLAWCRGVDGIVGRGGRPWPMAAAQRPSGRRLAALATACSDNAMLKIVSATRDAKFACQASLDGRLREGAHSQSGAPATLDASTTDRGCCMGLVPPAKAFHLQVATSKSDCFPAESSHSQLAFWPVDRLRTATATAFRFFETLHCGRCCLDAETKRRRNPREPPPEP